MAGPGSTSRRVHARARRRRRSVPSCGGGPSARAAVAACRAKCRIEGIARAREHFADARGGAARLLAVVVGCIGDVVAEGASVVTAARIVAGEDALVRAALEPVVQLRCAGRVEGVRSEEEVEHLEHAVERMSADLVPVSYTHL